MFHLLLILIFVFTAIYGILILMYRYWFLKLKYFNQPENYAAKTRFSIIIPARNESENLTNFLSSILNQNYPLHLYEVIVVDDHSTDDSVSKVQAYQKEHRNLKLIELGKHPALGITKAFKKKAIEIAITEASGEWIITTDADCKANPNWLSQYDAHIQTYQPVFIAAPVMFFREHGVLNIFQVLDFMSLQGITAAAVGAGSHAMCNGANLAYLKTAFYEVGKFSGIDHLASGDDMLLMHKMKLKYPNRLSYLFHQEAIIFTKAMPDLKSFMNQRIRWASKADSYQDNRIFFVLLLVYLYNFLLALSAITIFFLPSAAFYLLISVCIKTCIELSFMYPVSKFYKLENSLLYFPIMQPFHIIYTIIAGWLGKFGSYQWKGRKLQ